MDIRAALILGGARATDYPRECGKYYPMVLVAKVGS